MKKRLMNNLALKILSVFGAILLWLVVVNVDDPVKTETYTGIRVSMLNENAITSKGKVYKIEDDSDVISVSVSAKRSVHKYLTSADFVATADMEKDIQYDNLIAINVTCTNKNVKNEDIKKSRNNVKVSIEDSATEEFNVVVKSRGTPGSGYVVGEMIPEQRVIAVTGPASIIARIKRIEAEVDVTGRTADDTVICGLNMLNSDGDQLDTTYLQYNGKTTGISVKINMLKTKEVALRFGVSGTPGSGAVYRGLTYKPEVIEVAGTVNDLQGLYAIDIPGEAVNIDGLTETQTVEVSLAQYLPQNLRLVDEAADGLAVVTVEIEQRKTKEVTLPISRVALTGIPRGYSVSFGDLEQVVIPVSGLAEDLEELNPDEIVLVLDVSEHRKAGEYTGTLAVHIPRDLEVGSEIQVEYELLKGDSGLGNSELPDDILGAGDSQEPNPGASDDDSTAGADGTGSSGTGTPGSNGTGDPGMDESGASGTEGAGTGSGGTPDASGTGTSENQES